MSGSLDQSVERARLSAIQAVSQDFRGFSETDLDELFPYLTFIDFREGDEVVTVGEDATWVGLLLGGQLDVVMQKGGAILGSLYPGRIVGEMAFFRGGRRGASIFGVEAGMIATLKFADMPLLYMRSAAAATNMVLALGRAAVRKLEQKQDIIPMEPRSFHKERKFEKAAAVLEQRGFTKDEVSMLIKSMHLFHFYAGQNIFKREHTLFQFGIVLQGSVEQGASRPKTSHPGDLVGEYEVLSGHPLPAHAVGGPSGGVVGLLSLDLREIGATDELADSPAARRPTGSCVKGDYGQEAAAEVAVASGVGRIAMKIFRLLGIAATSSGAVGIDDAAGSILRENTIESSAISVEVLYRERVRAEAKKVAEEKEAREAAEHGKSNVEVLLRKALREKSELLQRNASVSEELKHVSKLQRSAQKASANMKTELDAHRVRAERLQDNLNLVRDGSAHVQEIIRLQAEKEERDGNMEYLRDEMGRITERHEKLESSASWMEMRLAVSVPRARVRWQLSRLKVTCRGLRQGVRYLEEDVEDLRAELQTVVASSMASLEAARAETVKKRVMLDEERSKTAMLTTALTQASETVAMLQRRQGGLVMTAREAATKARAMEEYGAREADGRASAAATTEEVREELRHARWELSQSAVTETKLREQLYNEQMARQQAEEGLLLARTHTPEESAEQLRACAKAAAAEAAAATASAMELSQSSLQEAACARIERDRLEERCRELKRVARAAGARIPGVRQVSLATRDFAWASHTRPSTASSAPPTPMSGSRRGEPWHRQQPMTSLPVVSPHASDRGNAALPVAALHAHILNLVQREPAQGCRGRAITPPKKRRPLTPATAVPYMPLTALLRPSSSASSLRPSVAQHR